MKTALHDRLKLMSITSNQM